MKAIVRLLLNSTSVPADLARALWEDAVRDDDTKAMTLLLTRADTPDDVVDVGRSHPAPPIAAAAHLRDRDGGVAWASSDADGHQLCAWFERSPVIPDSIADRVRAGSPMSARRLIGVAQSSHLAAAVSGCLVEAATDVLIAATVNGPKGPARPSETLRAVADFPGLPAVAAERVVDVLAGETGCSSMLMRALFALAELPDMTVDLAAKLRAVLDSQPEEAGATINQIRAAVPSNELIRQVRAARRQADGPDGLTGVVAAAHACRHANSGGWGLWASLLPWLPAADVDAAPMTGAHSRIARWGVHAASYAGNHETAVSIALAVNDLGLAGVIVERAVAAHDAKTVTRWVLRATTRHVHQSNHGRQLQALSARGLLSAAPDVAADAELLIQLPPEARREFADAVIAHLADGTGNDTQDLVDRIDVFLAIVASKPGTNLADAVDAATAAT